MFDDDEIYYNDDENNYVYDNYVCENCGYEWLADDYTYSCPICGSNSIHRSF